MKIFRLKDDWEMSISNSRIGFQVGHKRGTLFFEEKKEGDSQYLYYPDDGGYPVWENSNFKFVDERLEFVEETDKPKEYYTMKQYTEHQLQTALKNNKT